MKHRDAPLENAWHQMLSRRSVIRGSTALLVAAAGGLPAVVPARAQEAALAEILKAAARLRPLQTVVVARNGAVIAEQGYRGHKASRPTNIKSASKAIISALVGIAIDRGHLTGVDQRVADLLPKDIPKAADPRIKDVTLSHLLSMQAGLRRTSGPNYGAWIASANWVRSALAQPFEQDPGGPMQYSTGSSHLLSAILTKVTGKSTLANAHNWLAAVDDFRIEAWDRDLQGIYMGGNNMAMSPRSLLAFGDVYRSGGVAPNGDRVISQAWIEQSWTTRTYSRWTGDDYGYGWFTRTIGGEEVRYAWGFGGQMLYIVPDLALTVVMTSDETTRASTTGHRDRLHELLRDLVTAVRGD